MYHGEGGGENSVLLVPKGIKTAGILDFTVRLELFRRVLKLKACILDQKYGRVKNQIELLLDDFVYLYLVFLQNETQTTIAEKLIRTFFS